MTRRLDFSWVYPLPPLALFQMATRLEHLEEKALHLGHQGHAVKELRPRGDLFRSVTTREVEAQIPWYAFLMRLAPAKMITQTQVWHPARWDGHRRYDARVDVSGVPVTITGWGELEPLEWNHTRYSIHLDVESRAWPAGNTIETSVAGSLQTAIDAEHSFRLLWLDRSLRR
jgi:hypothetical protein